MYDHVIPDEGEYGVRHVLGDCVYSDASHEVLAPTVPVSSGRDPGGWDVVEASCSTLCVD
jgi:hypothetical protein